MVGEEILISSLSWPINGRVPIKFSPISVITKLQYTLADITLSEIEISLTSSLMSIGDELDPQVTGYNLIYLIEKSPVNCCCIIGYDYSELMSPPLKMRF